MAGKERHTIRRSKRDDDVSERRVCEQSRNVLPSRRRVRDAIRPQTHSQPKAAFLRKLLGDSRVVDDPSGAVEQHDLKDSKEDDAGGEHGVAALRSVAERADEDDEDGDDVELREARDRFSFRTSEGERVETDLGEDLEDDASRTKERVLRSLDPRRRLKKEEAAKIRGVSDSMMRRDE